MKGPIKFAAILAGSCNYGRIRLPFERNGQDLPDQ